ncbi:MAG: hypothetical protein P1P76_08455 [Anaerolineales bacterium]|nr:hypothetical protein [Anaerolineales bacterium]
MLINRLAPFLLALAITGCSLVSPAPTGQLATPPSGTIAPAAEARFVVTAPEGTPANAELTLVLLDPVTDLNFNTRRIPMEAQSDGRWSVALTPPAGSLLYYRYEKSAPGEAIELTSEGVPVDYRTAYIPGPGEIHERIARWSGETMQGETGRILGQILSLDDQPLAEMLVSAGGKIAFTDGEGRFRLDGLPPGLHTITVFSPTGSFHPIRQEALLAPAKTTPVTLKLEPAEPIVVTFQVTVPADTPEEATLRLAGNTAQLGFRFNRSRHDSFQSVSQMPALVRVDPEHFLGVFTLYDGTDLHYKYTLGDGVWNAERGANSSFTIRRVMLEGDSPTLRDTVHSWSDGSSEATRFEVAIPDFTPPGDTVSLQFRSGSWRTPLPMWKQDGLWTYALYGPESMQRDVQYRYCRNLQCGAADEAGFAGSEASGRQLDPDLRGALIQDVIDEWQFLDRTAHLEHSSVETQPLEHLTTGGVDLSNESDPSWHTYAPQAFTRIAQTGANEVLLSPAWRWVQNDPFPLLEMDPAWSPFGDELNALVQIARGQGLRVGLRPSFLAGEIPIDTWWEQAARDQLWWELWFEEYRSFVLTYASWAAQNGIERLVLGGADIVPALPFGSLPGGRPSGVPVDGESRWRDLIGEVRGVYGGQLAFELEVGEDLSTIPAFIDLFDEVHLFWHSPLVAGELDSSEILLAEIEAQLSAVLGERALEGKPVAISLAYLSLSDGASACPQRPDGTCRPLSDFSRGQIVDIDLEVDLQIQAQIFDAFLRAIADEPQISGFYARGFSPAVILHDKSASVYGKPAQEVLGAWFRDLPAP